VWPRQPIQNQPEPIFYAKLGHPTLLPTHFWTSYIHKILFGGAGYQEIERGAGAETNGTGGGETSDATRRRGAVIYRMCLRR